MDYTPTTEEVRKCAALEFHSESNVITETEFDRWLTEVKAQTWDYGFEAGVDYTIEHEPKRNPYRQGEN